MQERIMAGNRILATLTRHAQTPETRGPNDPSYMLEFSVYFDPRLEPPERDIIIRNYLEELLRG